ncbi:MAG: hypothetical protein QNI91_16180 [Arenicellales bacterium]|nr:hypothetical protein [Arenicellales bacterium]
MTTQLYDHRLAAILYADVAGYSRDEYFADGMTDDLITDLSRISGLFVIARNTVFPYKGKAVDCRCISITFTLRNM